MTFRRPKRRIVGRPNFLPDSRVPAVETWPEWGMAGKVGSGPYRDNWVIIDPFFASTGELDEYAVLLPADVMFGEDGLPSMSDGVTGDVRPGVGGLIDALTTEFDVEWHLDRETVEGAWRVRRDASKTSSP